MASSKIGIIVILVVVLGLDPLFFYFDIFSVFGYNFNIHRNAIAGK
jgi:hypothetical protein